MYCFTYLTASSTPILLAIYHSLPQVIKRKLFYFIYLFYYNYYYFFLFLVKAILILMTLYVILNLVSKQATFTPISVAIYIICDSKLSKICSFLILVTVTLRVVTPFISPNWVFNWKLTIFQLSLKLISPY